MNSIANRKEAFMVFFSLTFIGLFNVGQLWEEQRTSLSYANWELTERLELNENQMEKIKEINAVYEYEMSKMLSNDVDNIDLKKKKAERLILDRSRQIMNVLNEKQQQMIYTYCTDLLSFTKMFE